MLRAEAAAWWSEKGTQPLMKDQHTSVQDLRKGQVKEGLEFQV